ncbi:HD family phosphohydrolase [Bacteroidota bacterium]
MAKKATLFKHLNYQQAMEYYQEQETSKNTWYIKILIFSITTIVCTFFFAFHFDITTDQSLEYRTIPGYMWTNQKVDADYTFAVYKNYNDYISDVNKAKDKALSVFFIDQGAEDACFNHLEALNTSMKMYCNDSLDSPNGILTEPIYNELINIPRSTCYSVTSKIYTNLKAFIAKVYKNGLIDESVSSINQNEISVQAEPNLEKIFKKAYLTDISTIGAEAKKFLSKRLSDKELAVAIEIVNTLNHPNFIYSKDLSGKNRELASQTVARYEGIVRKGETIISKGEMVTESTLKKLTSYGKSKLIKSDVIYTFWSFVGGFGHSLIIYSILILYLFFIRRKIFSDNFQVAILSSLLILAAFFAWLTITISTKLPIEYLIIIPSLSMLAAIVFDSRTAFYVTVANAMMVSGIRGNDYITGLVLLFVGTIAAYTVRDIQNRTQMFQSILFIFLGFVVGIGAISLERAAEMTPTLNQLFIALINSLISPMITFGLLLLLERYSSITTDLRLQEYDKPSHPLLIKLSEIAPGTYQHTLSMAALAERCAGAINANPHLTKVGALYHDIGKLAKPEYFIENQLEIENKHNLLTPRKSAEAIRQHVIEGIKIGHEYELPKRIIDFIPTHHGTTLIKHFYATALEQAEDKNTVNQEDFRYPGPKPFSKETAIVMICDFSEALSRLEVKNKEELDKIIGANIRERLFDGQFDKCDITLKELELIKETCVKSLLGSAHQRIKYKEIPKEETDTNNRQNQEN